MKGLYKLAILFFLLSCAGGKSTAQLNHIKYYDWKQYALKKMTTELVVVCNEWPVMWGKCPDGASDSACISSIDIGKNIQIVKDLLDANESTSNVTVIQQFIEGFNNWHCETFLTKTDDAWQGIEFCKTSINGSLDDLESAPSTQKNKVMSNSEIDYYWNLKSGTFSSNGIIAITIIDRQLNIIKFNLVLYP